MIFNKLTKVLNFFFKKKEGKKARSLHPPTTILKTIFSNYDIKEFSEIGNSRGHFVPLVPRLAGSRSISLRSGK